LVTALLWLAGENYPASRFPMYSNYRPDNIYVPTLVVYITDANNTAMPWLQCCAIQESKIKKFLMFTRSVNMTLRRVYSTLRANAISQFRTTARKVAALNNTSAFYCNKSVVIIDPPGTPYDISLQQTQSQLNGTSLKNCGLALLKLWKEWIDVSFEEKQVKTSHQLIGLIRYIPNLPTTKRKERLKVSL